MISTLAKYLILILVTVDAKIMDKVCEVVSSEDHCFVKETLATISHNPNQLTVDRTTNTLYFSFDYGQGEYVPVIIQIDTKKISILKGVKDAFAMTNDLATGDMYFGGSHGIYRYNAKKKFLLRLNVNFLDVWWLFFKKKIYFIKFPSLNAFSYENKTLKYIEALRPYSIHQFVFDIEDDLFFINSTGLFGIKNDSDQPILLRDTPKFLGISLDNNGMVHVCSEDGIFIVSKIVQKVKRIVSIQGVLGMTFDAMNNIIYSDSHEIVRLLPLSNNEESSNYIGGFNKISNTIVYYLTAFYFTMACTTIFIDY